MKRVYNTDDNFYLDEDVYCAFQHAYVLGQSGGDQNVKQAFNEWRGEYARKSMSAPSLSDITKAVCSVIGITEHIIQVEHGRGKTLSMARSLISWFCYKYTKVNVVDIAQYVGYKNHSSVIHGYNVVNNELFYDRYMRGRVDAVKATLASCGHLLEVQERMSWKYPDKKTEIVKA